MAHTGQGSGNSSNCFAHFITTADIPSVLSSLSLHPCSILFAFSCESEGLQSDTVKPGFQRGSCSKNNAKTQRTYVHFSEQDFVTHLAHAQTYRWEKTDGLFAHYCTAFISSTPAPSNWVRERGGAGQECATKDGRCKMIWELFQFVPRCLWWLGVWHGEDEHRNTKPTWEFGAGDPLVVTLRVRSKPGK